MGSSSPPETLGNPYVRPPWLSLGSQLSSEHPSLAQPGCQPPCSPYVRPPWLSLGSQLSSEQPSLAQPSCQPQPGKLSAWQPGFQSLIIQALAHSSSLKAFQYTTLQYTIYYILFAVYYLLFTIYYIVYRAVAKLCRKEVALTVSVMCEGAAVNSCRKGKASCLLPVRGRLSLCSRKAAGCFCAV